MFLEPSEKELSIVKKNWKLSEKIHNFYDYKKKICIKPWGYEFLIYSNEKVGIWFLRINKGHQTSLHTHFKKDTLLITFKGAAQVNLWDKTIILNEMDFLYIPKYCFHGFGSFSDYVYLIEIEVYEKNTNFSDKNDLLRIKDIYQRDYTGYETSINLSTDLELYSYFYLEGELKKQIENSELCYREIKDLSEIDDKCLNILIQGELWVDGMVIKEGTILKKSSNMHLLNNSIQILSLFSIDKKENSKIINDLHHLEVLLQTIDKTKNKIILSSGCFDIIHVGHLSTLKRAKELGDILIVCLSCDDQIKKLKGKDRPINNYQDRIDLFKTIAYVDYIILYNEENIEKEKTLDDIMKIINPFAWVKGNDYNKEEILEKHPHLENIILIDNVVGKGTTKIIEKCR